MSPTEFEQAALDQAQLLAGVLNSSLDGIVAFRAVRDEHGAIVDFAYTVVNRMAEQILGRPASSLINKRMLELFPGNKADGLFDAYANVVQTGEPFSTEHHYTHDGLNHWLNISATKCGDGFTATFADITDQVASNERFRVLFQCSTDAHLLFDDSGIIDCNQAAVEMLGYDDKQEMLNTHPAELSPEYQPDGRRSMDKCVEMDRAARENGYHRFDWVHRRKDGSDIPVEVTLNPVQIAGKDTLLVVWHDLTERVEAERAVREAVERLNEAQALANLGSWQWTPATNQIVWSDQTKRIFGVPLDRPPPDFETHQQQIHPDDLEHWRSVVEQAMRDRASYTMKFRAVLPDGRVRTIEGRGQVETGPDGEVARMFGTVQDITERQASRQELKTANERFQLLVAGNASGVWDWDCQTDVLYWSPRFKELVGYRDDEIDPTYADFESRLHPEDRERVIDSLQRHVNGGCVYDVEYRLRHKDGHYVWCQASGQAQWDDDGRPLRMAGSITDITERKATERELQKLSMVAARTEDGVVITDARGRIEWANPAFTKITGYDLDTLRGKTPGSILQGPDTDAETVKRIRENLAKKQGFRETILNYRANGESYWVEVEVQPLMDDEGNVVNFMAIERDVTERLEQQAKLDEHRRRLEFALETSRSGLWDWYFEDDSVYFSDMWYRMLGYEPGELPMAFETWASLAHPEDLPRAKAALTQYLEGRTHQYACEMRMRNKSGHWQWIKTIGQGAERDVSGRINRIVGMHVDIHRQKLAQQAIEEHQNRLEFALDATRTGLWDWLVDTTDTYFSKSWYTMLGYDPDELPMSLDTWVELCHPEDILLAKAALDRYFAGETDRYVCEFRMRNKDGDWQWILDVGEASERDADGRVLRMVGLHVDIHQQKLAQQEIEQARDLAQQASAAKSAFVANMSHEIRTPMNAILGYADLLLDAEQTEADKRNHAVTIQRNGKHLMGLLNDVLDLSKIEAGKMTVEHIACSPDELFFDVVSLMTPQATAKGIELDFEAVDPMPDRVKTDPMRLKQVLINLLGNAIKFTEAGSVRLAVRWERANNDRPELVCEIADTGIGMQHEQVEQLFQPFSQADNSTTRRFGGTGLGLAISHNLCKLLGGDLACQSTPGRGSVFTARFEVEPAEKPIDPPNKPARQPQNALVGRRVLVVEDGLDNQRLIRHFLTKAGAQAELAENGEAGRDMTLAAERAGEPYDVVLMDMQMPVLDGYNATRELRAAGYTRPIIALTAHSSSADRQACLDAGCTDYLPKPIDRETLVKTVSAYVHTQLQHGGGI